MEIELNCQSSIRIGDIYFDPYKIDSTKKVAKYIFITHPHYDHLSIEDLKKVSDNNTIIFAPTCCNNLLGNFNVKNIEIDKEYKIDETTSFKTFSSYNLTKPYHQKSKGYVGYLLNYKGNTFCITGDSDSTNELKKIKCDVLFICIGGTYTMDYKEASDLTNIISPKIVIPTHYIEVVGTKEDEEKFIQNLNKSIKCLPLLTTAKIFNY
jgi:L-ascorbate metabolism protein UlaG (beta-lactamase superfamily)